jgi:hypothetical protein
VTLGVRHRLQQFAVARTPKATDPAHALAV